MRWRGRVPSDRVDKRDGFADGLATSAEYPERDGDEDAVRENGEKSDRTIKF